MRTPTRIDLVELWMSSKFRGVSCIVFMDPLGDGGRIQLFRDRLGITCGTELGGIINSSVFILPQNDPDSVVNSLKRDEWGFVMSWNGESFTSHN